MGSTTPHAMEMRNAGQFSSYPSSSDSSSPSVKQDFLVSTEFEDVRASEGVREGARILNSQKCEIGAEVTAAHLYRRPPFWSNILWSNGILFFVLPIYMLHVVDKGIRREGERIEMRRSGEYSGQSYVWTSDAGFNVLSCCVREINTASIQLNDLASVGPRVCVCMRCASPYTSTHYNEIENVNRITLEEKNFDFAGVGDK